MAPIPSHQPIWCDEQGHWLFDGQDYIESEQGVRICLACYDAIAQADRDEWHDAAKASVGHDCLMRAERNADGLWTCSACGVVMQQAGDALVIPTDEVEVAPRGVFVIATPGDDPIALCSQCIPTLHDPGRAIDGIVRRNDALHCIECDYHLYCGDDCAGRESLAAYYAQIAQVVAQ